MCKHVVGIESIVRRDTPRHALLIDPADQSPDVAAKRAIAAAMAGSSMILIGGSSGTDSDNVDRTVVAIREALELIEWAATQDSDAETQGRIPIILFPQGANALSPNADGITFMMLMNSTDPRFLIGEQVAGAPFIKKAGIEPIPMGYLICTPGGKAGEVGKADLIKPEDTGRVASYAAAAELYGFKLLYLEAGSGAATPVSQDLISAARRSTDLPIVVGGGIRNGVTARIAVEAGADWIVTGTLGEEYWDADELREVLSELIISMRSNE
ncbi:MAG: phosphoglycerol geranylgeranyltransferase [Euryarchaeota archaeon]|nr:phosphoglycerol geranylgeranyltransferase [Euryarchaeota archaeon]RPG73310.1 MAG: phosphoglycerol geranylgeranyltransferase [Euryarchaeota archaeon TMED192]|tara:strand:+ start:3477 stop:4286 length:810 start_codon:yes stop_codon:yes gene_type:complete